MGSWFQIRFDDARIAFLPSIRVSVKTVTQRWHYDNRSVDFGSVVVMNYSSLLNYSSLELWNQLVGSTIWVQWFWWPAAVHEVSLNLIWQRRHDALVLRWDTPKSAVPSKSPSLPHWQHVVDCKLREWCGHLHGASTARVVSQKLYTEQFCNLLKDQYRNRAFNRTEDRWVGTRSAKNVCLNTGSASVSP